MAALLPLWVASSVAGTVGLPVTASVGLVGVLAALGSKRQKSNEVLILTTYIAVITSMDQAEAHDIPELYS